MGGDVVAANGRQVRLAKITVLKLKHPLGRIVVCVVFVLFVYGSVFCSLIQYIVNTTLIQYIWCFCP